MAKPRECRKLTGSPDRKAQKKALRKSVLTAFVSDAMQYILSSGVHCTQRPSALCGGWRVSYHSPHNTVQSLRV